MAFRLFLLSKSPYFFSQFKIMSIIQEHLYDSVRDGVYWSIDIIKTAKSRSEKSPILILNI